MARKTRSRFEIVKDVLLVVSIAGNITFGITNFAHQRKTSRADAEFKKLDAAHKQAVLDLQLESRKPQIVQRRLILTGTSLKALSGVDLRKAIIDGSPHPEFVETPLGKKLYGSVGATDKMLVLGGIEAEFLVFSNRGSTPAEAIRLEGPGGRDGQALGTLDPGTTKFLPVRFRQSHPFNEMRDNRAFRRYVYSYALGGKQFEAGEEIAAAGPVSWIPTLDTFHGAGKALVSRENEHLFRPLP